MRVRQKMSLTESFDFPTQISQWQRKNIQSLFTREVDTFVFLLFFALPGLFQTSLYFCLQWGWGAGGQSPGGMNTGRTWELTNTVVFLEQEESTEEMPQVSKLFQ